MGKTTKQEETVETMSLDELQRRVNQANQLIAQAIGLFPGLVTLTDEERAGSSGRIRKGEDDALVSVLDVADARPELFKSLADQDDGHDPEVFETQLLRDRFARRAVLAELQSKMDGFATNVADTVLQLGAKARGPAQAAYQIAKVVSNTDAKVRGKLAPALDFYGAIAKKSAATRAKKPKGA